MTPPKDHVQIRRVDTEDRLGPFRGHISIVTGLALSFDGTLLARRHHHQALGFQLLASFYIQEPHSIILSDQLIYTTW